MVLGFDIRENGLREPIALFGAWGDEDCLIDGRNRLDALASLGLLDLNNGHLVWKNRRACDCLDLFQYTGRNLDPYAIALSLNVHRRHIKTEAEKRDLIAKVLVANSELSNRQLGERVKDDHKKVGRVRSKLEATGQSPSSKRPKARTARPWPAKAGKKSKNSPAPIDDTPEAKPVSHGTKSAEISIERRAEHAALDLSPEEKGDGAASLDFVIERDWREAERAFEALTAHPVAQVAQVISPERVALVTEIAEYFAALVAELLDISRTVLWRGGAS